jgi:Spy/CpxP family protein refolding chaperone
MGKRKATMILVSSLLLVLTLTTTVAAQQRKQPPAGGLANILQNLGIREFVQGLQLTEAQRESIKSIIQGHKKQILETRKELLQARLALLKDDFDGPNKFGVAQARIASLRQDVMTQIAKTVLTPEQASILQTRQQKQIDRLRTLLERLGN